MGTISIDIQLSGGMELLFGNQSDIKATLPATNSSGNPTNMSDLILFTKDNLLTERPELFVSGSTVRPGILVLINDTDWELEGETEYQVQDGDKIVFISTLHGG
ncbi:Ubiquitin- modifier 1 [Entomophthora muscae]|uniref:Ubiquitin- modifier 1 n=1 Tax=Entomophthora muscae TaxID=34485 RepID=A0ACC2U4G7_9FUNG|nr:Ubiquitin- modifier 1 [Entomophthora muscae]